MKKKIICFIISVVLLLYCFISFGDNNAVVVAGVGNDDSASINNIEELTDVLAFIKGSMESGSTELTALSNYLGDIPSLPTYSKHSSATVNLVTSVTSKSSTDNTSLTGGLKSSESSLNRDMTCYFTEDATFYVTEGISYEKRVREKDTAEGLKTTTYASAMNFNMDVLITKDSCFVNFREFSHIDNEETRVIKEEYKGKWIEMPYAIVNQCVSIDEDNREILSSFEEMFDYLCETDKISQSDEVVSFDENDFIEMLNGAGADVEADPKDHDLDFIIDLSNPYSSLISIKNNVNKTQEYSSNKVYGKIETKATINYTFVIYNVDNTVINWDGSDVKLSANNMNELDYLFVITEFEEEE